MGGWWIAMLLKFGKLACGADAGTAIPHPYESV
jgi:hypothetical protein